MNTGDASSFASLERVFHEPARLAIMSVLCAADAPLSFGELKESCRLTDGNLSRHLRVLLAKDDGGDRVECVGLYPEVFQIAMVARDEHQPGFPVPGVQQARKNCIQGLQRFQS